jgi:hypothetical protein
LPADIGSPKVESFEQEGNNVAPVRKSCFNLAPQPIAGIVTALECRWREQDKEVGAGFYVFNDDALKVPTCQSVEIEENVKAVLRKILEDGECPESIGPAVTEKNCFFDTFHKTLD